MRMPTITPARLLTAEEFARLPQPEDGTQQELVKGVIITMPSPSFYHGLCCNRIGRKLGNFVDEGQRGFVTNNDSGVILARDPDTVRGPDLAFWGRERMPEFPRQGYPSVPPDLVVEVLSPSDVFLTVQRKVLQYLGAGVRLVWIMVPEDRSVAVYRPGQDPRILSNSDTLSGEDVLAGFSCPVTELFP
jgi:Uma2 family endonuclease